MTWEQAKEECRIHDGNLATFHTKNERKLFQEDHKKYADFWLGYIWEDQRDGKASFSH